MEAEVTLTRKQWEEVRDCARRKLHGLDGKQFPSRMTGLVNMRELAREALAVPGQTLTASVSLARTVDGELMEVAPEIRTAFKRAAGEIIAAGKATRVAAED